MKSIVFVTSHAKKAEELSLYLDRPVTHHKLDLTEIQSLDPHEVARLKAEEAYKQMATPVLVEDYSLRLEALGKLPGTLIKWFLDEIGVEGVSHLLDSYDNRTAYAQTCFGYCDEDGSRVFDGILKGTVPVAARGDHGYGTDSIFIPDGQDKTWGEMSQDELNQYSIRRIALEKLEAYLQQKNT